jgi:hypothetical protein
MWYVLAAVIVLIVVAEAGARRFGLGRPLLYERTGYGYRVVPNQSLQRFGNRVFYNAQGMRSETISDLPPEGTFRVLCIGDSVTFGTTATDQASTYPYLLQGELSQPGRPRVEVLNASAGGWAVENEEGWLKSHGVYGSHVVVLQVATHDLFQKPASSGIVGNHPQFPDRRPVLALQELVMRYLLPRIRSVFGARYGDDDGPRTREDVPRTMAAIDRIAALARASGAELIVLYIEQPRGLEPDDELSRYAKESLLSTLARLNVTLVRPAEAMEAKGGRKLFQDGVHPDAAGNRVLSQELAGAILGHMGKARAPRAEGNAGILSAA